MKILKILVLSYALMIAPYGMKAIAQQLPSFEGGCNINTEGDIEVWGSLDCTTAFVFPPNKGSLKVTAVTSASPVCSQVQSYANIADSLADKAEKFGQKCVAIDDPNELLECLEVWKNINEGYLSARSVLDPFYSKFGARVNMLAEMSWAQNRTKIAELNPDINVVNVPILAAFLTYNPNRVPQGNDGYNTVLEVNVPGIKNNMNSFRAGTADENNEVATSPKYETVAMGAAMAGAMDFSVGAACQDNILDADEFNGNLAYFVPFQTKASVEISVDANFLAERVATRTVEMNGDVTLNDLTTDLFKLSESGENGFKVKVSSGLTPPDGSGFTVDEYAQEYVKQAMETLSASILSQIGEVQAANVELPPTTVDGKRVEDRQKTVCSRRWFRKKCHNVSYKVTLPVNEIETVTKKILADINYSTDAEFVRVNTFNVVRTSAFVPEKVE